MWDNTPPTYKYTNDERFMTPLTPFPPKFKYKV